jgi:exodeoxyribonuclease-3
MLKLISWNVNGLRAVLGKGFLEFFDNKKPDILCLQETKLSEGQLDLALEGYTPYFNYAEKKGYSGTAVYTRIMPLSINYGIGIEEHDHEGRVITLEYADCFVVDVYTPNAQRGLERLSYRMTWEDAFRSYLLSLNNKKPVIVCGDMNVAHQEIDIKNPKSNRESAGFTVEERGKFTELLDAGFLDTFRFFYPDRVNAYSWWSYMFKAREKNVGWRIDYFCVSKNLKGQIKDAAILADIMGSDHCPVELIVDEALFDNGDGSGHV